MVSLGLPTLVLPLAALGFSCASIVEKGSLLRTGLQGNVVCLVYLLGNGAQHGLTDNDGDTALHYAAYTGQVRNCKRCRGVYVWPQVVPCKAP